jgi:hypothetical protein
LHAIEGLSGKAMLVTPFALVIFRFLVDRYGPPVSVTVPWHILQARRHDQVLRGQSAPRPRNSREETMALDPGIRDLLQAIEEALAQQPAADDQAQLTELASRADLVRQAVKRALEDEPPATTATWVRVHAGLPPRHQSGA